MKEYRISTSHTRMLSDTTTPVSLYLKLRDQYPGTLLLESSDYRSRENSYSYICCRPMASIKIDQQQVTESYPDGEVIRHNIDHGDIAVNRMHEFSQAFAADESEFKFVTNGLFGYMCYDAVQFFEDIQINNELPAYKSIPLIQYSVFRYVIVIDHYKNTLHVFEHNIPDTAYAASQVNDLITIIDNVTVPRYHFETRDEERSNLTDAEHMANIELGKKHCRRGDVFQIVLSREFRRTFLGDEFNVYRTLRAINPSPYLYYFDYGNFKILGSSPEAQLTVRKGIARINPIAGTFKRSGNDEEDAQLAEQLKQNNKENSEHVMLVDLARNDLSRNSAEVVVETFRDIHFYSHVIHMVSQVAGRVTGSNSIQIAADTFPAGTLSGAPKHMAMQLIDRYEPTGRGFYGGAIGFIGFNGDYNHAIIIRSLLSKNNTLIYQAGGGIVAQSNAEDELQEVNNKIAAVRRAIETAQNI